MKVCRKGAWVLFSVRIDASDAKWGFQFSTCKMSQCILALSYFENKSLIRCLKSRQASIFWQFVIWSHIFQADNLYGTDRTFFRSCWGIPPPAEWVNVLFRTVFLKICQIFVEFALLTFFVCWKSYALFPWSSIDSNFFLLQS